MPQVIPQPGSKSPVPAETPAPAANPRETVLTDSDVEAMRLLIAVCRSILEERFKDIVFDLKSIAIRTDGGPVVYRLGIQRDIQVPEDSEFKVTPDNLFQAQSGSVFLYVGITNDRRVAVARRMANDRLLGGQYMLEFKELRTGAEEVKLLRMAVFQALRTLERPGVLNVPIDAPLEERPVMIFPVALPPSLSKPAK